MASGDLYGPLVISGDNVEFFNKKRNINESRGFRTGFCHMLVSLYVSFAVQSFHYV